MKKKIILLIIIAIITCIGIYYFNLDFRQWCDENICKKEITQKNTKFIDLKRNKIICYDNLTNYYNEKNTRIKVFTKNEINELKSDTALLDIDDVSIINSYEKSHLNQKNSDDLTANFISETKSKIYTLKK